MAGKHQLRGLLGVGVQQVYAGDGHAQTAALAATMLLLLLLLSLLRGGGALQTRRASQQVAGTACGHRDSGCTHIYMEAATQADTQPASKAEACMPAGEGHSPAAWEPSARRQPGPALPASPPAAARRPARLPA